MYSPETEHALLADLISDPSTVGVYADWLEDQQRGESAAWRGWVDRIDALSPAQERLLPFWRDAWLSVGLAATAEPIDKAEVTRWVAEAYRVAGLSPPKAYLWLDSPLRGAIAAVTLASPSVPFRTASSVIGEVADQSRPLAEGYDTSSVKDQMNAVTQKIHSGLAGRASQGVTYWATSEVQTQVANQVYSEVQYPLYSALHSEVVLNVHARHFDRIYRRAASAHHGSHDADWLSFYSFLLNPCRLTTCQQLLPLMRLAHHAGWWWPLRDVAIVTPRPSRLVMRGGKLAEIEYPDGWGVKRPDSGSRP